MQECWGKESLCFGHKDINKGKALTKFEGKELETWVGSLPPPFTLILASACYYGSASSLLKSLLASVLMSSNTESINLSLERHPLEAEMEYLWNNLSPRVCTQPQNQQFCKRGVETEATTYIREPSKTLLPETSRELTKHTGEEGGGLDVRLASCRDLSSALCLPQLTKTLQVFALHAEG